MLRISLQRSAQFATGRIRRGGHDRIARFNVLPPPLSAKFAHQFHRFIDNAGGDIERGTETDRVLTRTKSQDAAIEEAVPKFFSRFWIGQIEGEK
jgi:hypothetical protein